MQANDKHELSESTASPGAPEWLSAAESVERFAELSIAEDFARDKAEELNLHGALTETRAAEILARCQSRVKLDCKERRRVDELLEWNASRAGLTMKFSSARDEPDHDQYAFFSANGSLVAKVASFSAACDFLSFMRDRRSIGDGIEAKAPGPSQTGRRL